MNSSHVHSHSLRARRRRGSARAYKDVAIVVDAAQADGLAKKVRVWSQ